jgi:NADH-quinone oxidoreductase subunit F
MSKQITFMVCQETPCLSMGSDAVYEALKMEVKRQRATRCKVSLTGCHGHGLCGHGPSVVVEPDGIFYLRVQPEDAPEIISSHFKNNVPVARLLYHDPTTGQVIPRYSDVNFYKNQQRLILRNCGHINPEKIEEYIAHGGYEALQKALLTMPPQGVLEEVVKSGLRGRGGAGFPTAKKWEFCRNAPGEP